MTKAEEQRVLDSPELLNEMKADFYADGDATGRLWTDSYRPGGPWRHGNLCAVLNAEWLRGFDDAVRAKTQASACSN